MENKSSNQEAYTVADFSTLLQFPEIQWKADSYYLVHGSFNAFASGKIYISTVVSQIPILLQFLIPELISLKLSFAVIKDNLSAGIVLNGIAGIEHIGKVLIIAKPQNPEELFERIKPVLSNFDGPLIPGTQMLSKNIFTDLDAHQLANNRFKRVYILDNKYIVTASLKNDPKGEVLKGRYFKRFIPKKCIIKEGKLHMISDHAGRDMADRLKWQKTLYDRLAHLNIMPKVLDLFTEEGNTFLVIEFINGKSLGDIIPEYYNKLVWKAQHYKTKIVLLNLLLQVLEMVRMVHHEGILHRDLSSANFMLTRKHKLYLIDWELAFDMQAQYPLPPFGYGTPGFMSPQQNKAAHPTVKDDIYGISALMLLFFTGFNPRNMAMNSTMALKSFVMDRTHEEGIARLIAEGLDPIPEMRPFLSELTQAVERLRFKLVKNHVHQHNEL